MNDAERNEYIEFIKYVKQNTSKREEERARYNYKKAYRNFQNVDEMLKCNPDDEKLNNLDTLIIFLCLKYNIRPCQYLNEIVVNHPIEIIRFIDKDCENFIRVCQDKLKKNPFIQKYLYPLIVKMLIYSKKSKLDSITTKDILNLDNENFHKDKKLRKQFIQNIERIYGIYNGKATPQTINVLAIRKTDIDKFGTDHIIITYRIKEYIEKEYESKGYQSKNPIESLKKFFSWLYQNYYDCSDVNLINREYWLEYRKYITESNLSLCTKKFRIADMIKFFNWIQENKLIQEQITEFNENSGISVSEVESSTKQRMHKSREYSKVILSNMLVYKPQDVKQLLLKCLILIASATGLRLTEILWLGPGCISATKGNVGEIILQINEKSDIKNKPTSILPWGITAVKILEERLKSLKYIKFYHKKSRTYYQSLFQYEGKIFSPYVASKEFKKILDKIGIDNNIIFESGSLYHALRHQKFVDIYDITGGSLIAVKVDSGHNSLRSLKTYTMQNKVERQKKALKFVEEGIIVAKEAEILKDLVKTPFNPEKYMEIIQKMNLSNNITIDGVKRTMRFLGFGYCSAKKCLLAPICEGCDFFWTCKTFENELADRYAVNFLLIKSRINKILEDNDEDSISLISGLAYQKKWLKEIGVSDDKIALVQIRYMDVKS